ncbi:LADA_0C04456g1_1 [Lachancea dasiensis]|uniref:Mitochondrial import inner membrane translocase subunit TIM54 n=1 Tax=Lachancea dasiensis TaxID=1072105 RepID=A0A1G4IYK9_9SACH|nr:LADA_0C04456g1_1 [Lachancea dasiensis]
MSGEEGSKSASVAGNAMKKPGYTNPAFKAMGIPPLRLPSRNWMLFWTVLTVSVSGIVYDKHQQKKITQKWCKVVEPLSQRKLAVHEKPRKITVFIAPPPSDYLDTSMGIWRRYVKPVLYSSGVDYEVFTEEKQGLIRVEVAERIRELRRELIKHEAELRRYEEEAKLWNRCKRALSQGLNQLKSKEEIDEEKEKLLALKFKAEFDYKNLLGVFLNNPRRDLEVVSEDALVSNPTMAGGVICIGRGAYKEYMDGLHEGILGPLSPAKENSSPKEEVSQSASLVDHELETEEVTKPLEDSTPAPTSIESTKDEITAEKTDSETTELPKPIPKPYISPEDYAQAKLPKELTSGGTIREFGSDVPAIFHQPVLVLPMPNLVGFLNIPERIYRFYRRRYAAEAFCKATSSCVLQKIRPFEPSMDLDLAKFEENDWPKKWIKEGESKGSEWVRELKGDDRVLSKLSVFEPSLTESTDFKDE